MKVLVTGGLGNVGIVTLRALKTHGHEVACLDLQTKGNSKRANEESGITYMWGDVTKYETVLQAVVGQDVIVHLTAILPPMSDEDPARAEKVNIGGTQNLLKAAASQDQPPKFLFSSSFDLFGPTMDQEPPRKITDAVQPTDPYSRHKIECERLIKASGLTWTIYRFADVPSMDVRKPHPIMFRIPLEQRFEIVHPVDVALAIANGLETSTQDGVWGSSWLVGGGPSCQIRYGEYLRVGLRQAGFGEAMFPPHAFSQQPYCTDWLDSSPAEELLHYQRHTFQETMADVDRATAPSAVSKIFIYLVRPVLRRWVLSFSPYYKEAKKAKGLASVSAAS